MRGAVLYGTKDVRFEERADPKIVEPTDVILKLSANWSAGRICGPIAASMRRRDRRRWDTNIAGSSRMLAAR
jgi:hypothetical protein